MAAQARECDYCNSHIPQDFAPPDMDKDEVISILHNVLRENSRGKKQFRTWAANMPFVPSEIFTYEASSSDDDGSGRKSRARRRKKAKGRRHTRYQRGGGMRRNVAHIMTLIVYASIIYYGLPYAGDAIMKLETLLVSSGLLPKLCGKLEEVSAILTPGDNICRLREAAYDRMITGISGSLVAIAAGWGYVKGNIWNTAKMDWSALTDKFDNMLKTFENNKAIDIVTDQVAVDPSKANKVESLEDAKTLAVLYKQELVDLGVDAELNGDIGVLDRIEEPDSQDHWGPDYSSYGEGYTSRHRRRAPHHSTRGRRSRGRRSRGRRSRGRRSRARGRGCMGGTRRK